MTQKDKIKLANAVIKGQALSLIEDMCKSKYQPCKLSDSFIEELKEIISNIITE